MLRFEPEAQILLGLYFLITLVLGVRGASEAKKSENDYLLAGRKLTLPAFVASLVSTWYGGILGVGEFTWRYGISNWLVFGAPYYLFAIVFALFLAKKARRTQRYTIPDQLEASYGRRAGIAGAAFIFILSLPAPYLLMMGVLISLFFPIPLSVSMIFAAAFSFAYIYRGGLSAVVRTDIFQFALMFAGFILIVGFAVFEHGGVAFLTKNLPPAHLTWHGGNSVQYILVWYVIAASTLVDPNFYQRCFAAKTENTARRGIFISVIFWLFFDFLTTTTGLYARVLLPDLADPVAAFPLLAGSILPPSAQGVFFVGLFATIMSTLDSFSFVSAITLGRDILGKFQFMEKLASQQKIIAFALVFSLAISIMLALAVDSVIDLWYQLGSVAAPALAIPLAASFSPRWKMQPNAAFFSIVFSGLTSLIWLAAGSKTSGSLWGIEPIFPGLALSASIYAFDKFRPQ